MGLGAGLPQGTAWRAAVPGAVVPIGRSWAVLDPKPWWLPHAGDRLARVPCAGHGHVHGGEVRAAMKPKP